MMEPRLQHLRYFIAVADERSFTRAANRVGITQPSLSEAIREFESQLQLSLFTRSSRFVEVSEDGAELLQSARDTIQAVDRFRSRALALSRQSSSAELRIGAPLYSACPSLEFEILERYSQDFPSSSPTLVRRTIVDLIEILKSGNIDLALMLGPYMDSDLSFIQIATIPFYLAVPASSPFAHRGPVSLGSLKGLHVASFDRAHSPGTFDALMAPLHAAGLVLENVLEASQIGMRRYCEANGGAMVLSEEMLPGISTDGSFVCLPVTDLQLSLDLKLARNNAPLTKGAQRFWDFVHATCRQFQSFHRANL